MVTLYGNVQVLRLLQISQRGILIQREEGDAFLDPAQGGTVRTFGHHYGYVCISQNEFEPFRWRRCIKRDIGSSCFENGKLCDDQFERRLYTHPNEHIG